MKHVFRRRTRLVAVLVVMIGGTVAGGVSYASVPDSSGVIHGCYSRLNGTLRVIDTAVKSQKCGTNELAVNWNRTGPGSSPAEGLSLPRGEGRREDLRLLLLERRGAMQARNAALNQLSALVVTAPEQVRVRLGALSGKRLAQAAARLRPRAEVMNGVLRRLGERAERLSKEVADAERALAALITEIAPELLEECGVGPACGT
jgi:hypothetical protein